VRGAFYRPIKQQLTLRIDADIVAWFKEQTRDGKGYQTIITRRCANMSSGMQRKMPKAYNLSQVRSNAALSRRPRSAT
jgi:hypothetical protein